MSAWGIMDPILSKIDNIMNVMKELVAINKHLPNAFKAKCNEILVSQQRRQKIAISTCLTTAQYLKLERKS